MESLVLVEIIEKKILLIRGQKVMLDADLAKLYGVTTKRLNEQVRRNQGRFPEDFMFQLSLMKKLRWSQFATTLPNLDFPLLSPMPSLNMESLMVASVLNTTKAIEISVFVVRAFVKMREMVVSNKEIVRRLDNLEKKYDSQFKVVFDALRALMSQPIKPKRKIGFDLKEKQARYSIKKSSRKEELLTLTN